MSVILHDIIHRNRAGAAVAIPSVCSTHPDVLRASILLAKETGRPLVVEATSNQVNQFGGYTGLRPSDFAALVQRLCAETGAERGKIVLGGDHLGPQVWRKEPAAVAMDRAAMMMAEYVRAGFTKIHLDCSQGCAGEPGQIDDRTAAERSAALAAACLAAAPDAKALSFIIGTEVPPPGGAHAGEDDPPVPTTPEAARATLAAHKKAFADAGLADHWPQVCGLVVQPGVEFSPTEVHHLPAGNNAPLRAVLNDWDGFTFEAHSTDYQHPDAYARLAAMGFAFHKVGPALTFAWREAVYGLDALARVMGAGHEPLADVAERVMLANPAYWQGHYHAVDAQDARLLRHFSYADRIRYYWPDAQMGAAVAQIFDFFAGIEVPTPALSQLFAPDVLSRAALLRDTYPQQAQAIVAAKVQLALAPYFFGEAAHG